MDAHPSARLFSASFSPEFQENERYTTIEDDAERRRAAP